MKKAIATILGTSILLSCVACTKGEETRATRRTSSTTEDTTEDTSDTVESSTEETTSETAESLTSETTEESSSETTADITTDSSSETEETTTAPKPAKNVIYLESKTGHERRAYSLRDKTSETGASGSVLMDVPFLIFETSGYADLQKKLYDEVFAPVIASESKKYDQALSALNSAYASSASLESTYLTYNIVPFRMDSRVVSFALVNEEESTVHNYDAESGEELTIDDVIKDKDAFKKVVEMTVKGSFNGEDIASQMSEEMTDGAASFGLTYDGIYLPNPSEFANIFWLKIPITGHEDLVNMDYFGKTPDSFTLFFNVDQTLAWDVTGDGKTDSIKVGFEQTPKPGYDFMTGKLVIEINGKAMEFMDLGVNDITPNYRRAFLVYDTEAYYLYATCGSVDSEEDTYIFKITGEGDLEYMDCTSSHFQNTFYMDPQDVEMYDLSFLLTFHHLTNSYNMTGTKGIPTVKNEYSYCYEPGVISKKELKGVTVDSSGMPTSQEITVPAETSFAIVGYSAEKGEILLEMLTPSGTENSRVAFKVEFDEDYNTFVAGVKDSEAFYDIMEDLW